MSRSRFEIKDLFSLEYFSEDLAKRYLLSSYFKTFPIFLLLEGPLGSGKTTFVKYLGKSLGIREKIDSPTFSLISEYSSKKAKLYHLDLYREAPSYLELSEIIQDSEDSATMICIEWVSLIFSEKISEKNSKNNNKNISSLKKIFQQKQNYLFLEFQFDFKFKEREKRVLELEVGKSKKFLKNFELKCSNL